MEFICTIVFGLEEVINFMLCSKLIFNMKMTKRVWRYIAVVGLAVAVNVISYFSILGIDGTDKDLIYAMLIVVMISEEKKLKSLIMEIDTVAIVSILGLVPYYLMLLITDTYRKDASILYSTIANTIIFLIMLFYIIYCYILKKNRNILELSMKQYLILALGLWSIILIAGFAQMFESMKILHVRMMNAIVLLTDLMGVSFLVVSLWLVKSTMKNVSYKYEKEIMVNQMKTQEQYVDAIVRQNEIIKKFRHDVRVHMAVLHKYIDDKEYNLAEKYIKSITGMIIENSFYIYTGIAVVDAVIADICTDLPDKEITLNWKGKIKGSEKRITEYELCIIFMNMMSNAIEACEKVEKNRNINVMVEYVDDEIHISEDNPINGKLETDEKGNLLSQKPDMENHGIGSRNIREIVEKYQGEIKYGIEGGRFYIIIII